jgi:uncharacterized protein YabE (DUF348 family)
VPTNTPKLNIPKPLGNEYFNRTKFNEILDVIDQNAASVEDLSTLETTVTSHLADTASLTQAGHVQLSSATDSTSETLAATPKAVKEVYDLANGKQDALPIENRRKITFGTADPTGGADGDIYFQYE